MPLARKPLMGYSEERRFLPQRLIDIPATAKSAAAAEGMVRIGGGQYDFQVSGIMIEGSNERLASTYSIRGKTLRAVTTNTR